MSDLNQRPSIGRIVLFRKAGDTLPAIITQVWSQTLVNLTVFTDGGPTEPYSSVEQGDDERQWNWPPRVQPFDFPAEVEHLTR